MSSSGSGRAQRSDVRRNREALLAAAEAAFAERGPTASLDEVARRAGLGAGTLHRHFPTKDALLEAVLVHRLDDLVDLAKAGCRADDTTAAFFGLLATLAREAGETMALAAALSATNEFSEPVAAAGATLQADFARLLRLAQRAGGVRSDVTAAELHALVAGIVTAERALPESSRGRGLEIVADGLRTGT